MARPYLLLQPEMSRKFIFLSLINLFKNVKQGGTLYVSDFLV